MTNLKDDNTFEIDDLSTKLVEDYNFIMKGFDDENPLLQEKWEKDGDFFRKFSLYDSKSVCISGVL